MWKTCLLILVLWAGALLWRNIWPQANRDETQRHWPVPEAHPPPRAGVLL